MLPKFVAHHPFKYKTIFFSFFVHDGSNNVSPTTQTWCPEENDFLLERGNFFAQLIALWLHCRKQVISRTECEFLPDASWVRQVTYVQLGGLRLIKTSALQSVFLSLSIAMLSVRHCGSDLLPGTCTTTAQSVRAFLGLPVSWRSNVAAVTRGGRILGVPGQCAPKISWGATTRFVRTNSLSVIAFAGSFWEKIANQSFSALRSPTRIYLPNHILESLPLGQHVSELWNNFQSVIPHLGLCLFAQNCLQKQ